MVHHTRGIVLHTIKYSESSIIAKIYTEVLGLQTYMVRGIRSKSSKTKMALFQSLNLLELVADHKPNKAINNLKEVRSAHAYQSIPMNMVKRSFVFFIAELLVKSIREETTNQPLFDWLFKALTWLDLSEGQPVNFHLVFMMQLSRFLGFYPKNPMGDKALFFDLQEGLFCGEMPRHPNYTNTSITQHLLLLHEAGFENSRRLTLSNTERQALLDAMITYYKNHLPGFGTMKSLDVLRSLF